MTADGEAELARLRRRLAREHRIRLDAESIAEKAISRLYESDRLKTVFLATVSHELRTPLTSIAGFTALLLEHSDQISDAERTDMLGRIDRNTRVLLDLIDDLLEFSTVERDELRLDVGEVPLDELVAAVVAQLGSALEHHRVVVANEPGAVAAADERASTRILTNLLTNAVRFTPTGSTITITTSATGDRCTLQVDDEGPGVPEAERQLVFEKFYRGTGDDVVRTHGTGIGLAVVRRLTEAMGGTVAVHEAPGGGARFVVELPRA